MRTLLTRLLVPVAVAAGAIVLVLSTSSDGPQGERSASAATAPRSPHVILLVLDELPGDSLLDGRGRIDPVRYPNFAALAGDGSWFRNAYSFYDSTTKAVPLILDGLRPMKGSSADRRSHPRSVFDMFGRLGYRIVSSEEATALCPPRWCPGARTKRPAIIPRLNRGRPERFSRFVRSLRTGRRPTFWMKHVLLPHGPYLYLPSGARTRRGSRDLVPGMNSTAGFHDRFLTHHNEQRYLLQLGFVDRLLGSLLRRLRAKGMYDDAMIVVTADHGFAWRVGVDTRRSVSNGNVEELAPVPLIVKRPGQRRGRVNDAYVRTLDVAPTIADVLGFRLGYRADGRTGFGPAARRRRVVSMPTRDFSATVRMSGRRWQARRRKVVRRRLRQFGAAGHGLHTGIGPNRHLLGRAADDLERSSAATALRATIAEAGELRRVRRASGLVPAQIAGDLHGGRARVRRDIAVAVNGRIEAVGRSFHLRDEPTEHYAVMVPGSLLRQGSNVVEVFEVVRGRTLRLLASAR
jgi:hypothetical protein